MRRDLAGTMLTPAWPAGVRSVPFDAAHAPSVHALLAAAYAAGFGEVGPFDIWWPTLSADSEFDPGLCFIAVDPADRVVGAAQCWTSAFVKDIAVSPEWRGRGVGLALLLTAFAAFRARGAPHVDLKVHDDNAAAIRLYRRAGMREVPL